MKPPLSRPASFRFDSDLQPVEVKYSSALRVGVVGLGGYAGHIARLIQDSTNHARLVAACDPDLAGQSSAVESLRAGGGEAFPSFDAMLGAHAVGRCPLDAAWLPVPIHLHRPYVERCLEAGLPVMVEKPAAGCLEDVDAMIEAERRSGLPVLVGFQDLYFPENHTAKARLLEGTLGKIRHVGIAAAWPRSESYFTRNAWAGRMKHQGQWVRDSPLNNALAHPVHLALFMLGPTPGASARVVELDAELYRANSIETFDTCTIRFRTDTGVLVTLALTHACSESFDPVTTYVGDRGRLEATGDSLAWHMPGSAPAHEPIDRDMQNLSKCLAGSVRAGRRSDPHASLHTARAHAELIERVHREARITDIHRERVHEETRWSSHLHAVDRIEPMLRECANSGRLLSELPGGLGRLGSKPRLNVAHQGDRKLVGQ